MHAEMDYTFIQGLGWLKANPSVLGGGLWIKTSEHGVIMGRDEVLNLISSLQAYVSGEASNAR